MLLSNGEDPRLQARFTRRALLVGLGQIGLLGVLSDRLYRLQVVDSGKYKELATGNHVSTQLVLPERGRIFDRFGILLAENQQSLRVMMVPQLAGDVARILARLRTIVDISADDEERILRLAAKQSRRLPILVAGELSWEQIAQINVLAPQLPGLQTETGFNRVYAHGPHMGHLVGYMGSADRAAADTDPVLKVAGMRVGRSGIELGFDAWLRGESGSIRVELEGKSATVRQVERVPSKAGGDVVMSIDLVLQRRVLQLLANERRAALVALDVQSGEVMAMASHPGFDNAPLANGISDNDWSALQNSTDDPLTNRAIRGLYPPGSTFKMVTALAGLETGEINPRTRVSCTGSYEFSGQHFGCWKRSGHGSMDLHNAIKQSCDVYFYDVARRVGIERLAPMARRLGFGQSFDCGLPQQKAGVVPDPDWKIATLEQRWYGGETLLAGIGQGYVLATPLQIAVMAARLATGRAITPYLTRPSGPDIAGLGRPIAPELGLDASSLDAIRRGMAAVVNEDGGTANAVELGLDGVQMAGKTGTSQVSGLSRTRGLDELAWQQRDHSLFVGFAPLKKPRYAVAAIIEHGGGGSKVAAPIVREVMLELLARDPVAKPAYVARAANAGGEPAVGAVPARMGRIGAGGRG